MHAWYSGTHLFPSQVSGKDGSKNNFSSSISSSHYGNSDMKGRANQVLATEHSLHYPPTSWYGYYYPGYDPSYPKWDNRHYFHAGDGSEVPYSVNSLVQIFLNDQTTNVL
ncbi:hypothetical protein MKX01_035681 [Papaver californicum]|nr:hypothetical protein MKX01_035681 [Papaver californicum]